MRLKTLAISLFLIVFMSSCGRGSGSEAANIKAKINGNHSIALDYVRPGGKDVNLKGQMIVSQDATGKLSGNVSIISDKTQPERCYRGGILLDAESVVTGTTFTLAWKDLSGDKINIQGSIVGRTLEGTFVASDESESNKCSGRTGQFKSTF